MESARGEVEAEGAMNGQTDLTSTGQTDGVAEQKHREKKKKERKKEKKRRDNKKGNKSEKAHIRGKEWQRIPLVKSCCAPQFSDLSSRKHLQIQQE